MEVPRPYMIDGNPRGERIVRMGDPPGQRQPPPSDVALRVHGYVASESIERDLEGKLPVTPETMFAIGSTTKAFTATLVGMLDDESWEVRANAVQALGMIGDSAARVSVEPLTDDPNSMVRQVAEATLEKLR